MFPTRLILQWQSLCGPASSAANDAVQSRKTRSHSWMQLEMILGCRIAPQKPRARCCSTAEQRSPSSCTRSSPPMTGACANVPLHDTGNNCSCRCTTVHSSCAGVSASADAHAGSPPCLVQMDAVSLELSSDVCCMPPTSTSAQVHLPTGLPSWPPLSSSGVVFDMFRGFSYATTVRCLQLGPTRSPCPHQSRPILPRCSHVLS